MQNRPTDSNFAVLAFDHPVKTVENIGNSISNGLRTLGYKAETLIIPRQLSELAKMIANGIEGILSLGPLPLGLRLRNEFLHRSLQCPIWLYFLDSPIYDMLRVPITKDFLSDALTDKRLVPISPEAGYLRLLNLASLQGFWPSQTRILPFGCFPDLRPRNAGKKRKSSICVIGTIGGELGGGKIGDDLDSIIEKLKPPTIDSHRVSSLKDELLSNRSPAMPLEAILNNFNWKPEDWSSMENLSFACGIDSWVKRHRRLGAVRNLKGFPVDFYGGGWREALGDIPMFRYMGNVDHNDIAHLVAQYSAVLNFDPNWSDGLHDRVYTACSMGVSVITNENSALANSGLPHDLIFTYDINRPNIADIADSILSQNYGPSTPRPDVIANHGWPARLADFVCASLA